MGVKIKEREQAQRRARRLWAGVAGLALVVGLGWYGLYWHPKQVEQAAQTAIEQGDQLRGQNRMDEAARHYLRATELKPDLAQAWSNLAMTHAAAERFSEALPHFERALALDSGHFEAQIGLAISLDGLGRFLQAEEAYVQALALRSDYGGVYYNLGYLYQQQGLYAEAAVQYEEAVRRIPDFLQALANLGLVYDLQTIRARPSRSISRPSPPIRVKGRSMRGWVRAI